MSGGGICPTFIMLLPLLTVIVMPLPSVSLFRSYHGRVAFFSQFGASDLRPFRNEVETHTRRFHWRRPTPNN